LNHLNLQRRLLGLQLLDQGRDKLLVPGVLVQPELDRRLPELASKG
jgi:hypothetical protein